MKIFFIFLVLLFGCNTQTKESTSSDSAANRDTLSPTQKTVADTAESNTTEPVEKVYSNQRFKNVKVQRLDSAKLRITGTAQVFEAAFSWYVTNGSKEILSGHEMTDAGAPAFGNFDFIISLNSQQKATLVLYEASAKDGSRQYELKIPI